MVMIMMCLVGTWFAAVVGFGPVPYRPPTMTPSAIFGNTPCTVFGDFAGNIAESRKVCVNTDGRCSSVQMPPVKVGNWCMVTRTDSSDNFMRDLYNNGMRVCKHAAAPSALAKLNATLAAIAICKAPLPASTSESECKCRREDQNRVVCQGLPLGLCQHDPLNCNYCGGTWCDGDVADVGRWTLKTELSVLPTQDPASTQSEYFNIAPTFAPGAMGSFKSCDSTVPKTGTTVPPNVVPPNKYNYFHVICNVYEYGAERMNSRPNDFKTTDAAGLGVRGSKLCSELVDVTTTVTTTSTTTTTVLNPRCLQPFVVCNVSDGTQSGCPNAQSTSAGNGESAAIKSVAGINLDDNACADYCSGATRYANLCVRATMMLPKDGVATTCTAVHHKSNRSAGQIDLAQSQAAVSLLSVNTIIQTKYCTAAGVEGGVCKPPDGGWTECYSTDPVLAADGVWASKFTLLHFPISASYLFITDGVGQQAGPCPKNTFPECMQAQAGVSVVRRYKDPSPRSGFRTWVMVSMRGATGRMSLVMNTCEARANCYLKANGLDYADADGGGELPFGRTVAGLNMSSVFWNPDNPLCNMTNGTVVSFVRMRDYDETSSAVDSYGELDQLGLPDPREGMADCKTKYYCMPGPCRLLDMNYFADPSYTNRFLEDSTWMKPSPRNMVRTSVGTVKGMVEMRGRSQCNPTFGTQKVFYKGEVFDPKNATQRNPNAASAGSYRYMSTPDTEKPLWPDVLPVPSPYAMPRTPGNNPNPEWMFDNSSMWNTPGSPRKRYRCDQANEEGGAGLRRAQPVLWLEPVRPCVVNCGPTVMYKVRTVYNKSAFTEAAAYWNSQEGCVVACQRGAEFRNENDAPSPDVCTQYCDSSTGARRKCSNPKDGVGGWCADMGQDQFGYTYEAFHYWGKLTGADASATVQFSPMHVGCQAQAGDTPKSLRPVISPLVSQFLDGACYKTSNGVNRLPHGVISTPYGAKHDFSMVTTYPQAAIDANTSHPGVFSSHAQAIGIMYPPYLQGLNATRAARAKLLALNPFIQWDDDVMLPEWNESSCHVFTSTDSAGSGCSMLPRAVVAQSPGCGEGEGNDTDVGNSTAVPTPPLTRFVQYALNLTNVDLRYGVHGTVWKEFHLCGGFGNGLTNADYNKVTWEEWKRVKGDSSSITKGDVSYSKWQECTDNLIHSWEGYTDNGPNHIADQLASLPSGQGYTVDETVLIDAFWTVFLPGGPSPPMPLPDTPVDDATQRAFESLFSKWGLSTEKGATKAKTDVLSTFGLKTYSPNCFFESGVNACHLADHCLLPGDRWAPDGVEKSCPKSANFSGGGDGERYWDTRGMPTGWYARSRKKPVGKWNTFALVDNQRERSTASFEIGKNAYVVGDKIGALYGFMQKNESNNNRQTITSPFRAPDIEWWGYNGIERNPPAYEHLIEGTRLGSGFGFLDMAVGFECTNAFASWEPASVPTDALHASSGDASNGMRAPTGQMECMVDDTSDDHKRNDTLNTPFERVFGQSSSTRDGSHTTLMRRDARLLEHLTYIDALEDEHPQTGTQTFRWWLGGTAVSLRASHFPQAGKGAGPYGRMKEMVKNAYAAVLVLNGTDGRRDGVRERLRSFNTDLPIRATMGDSSLVHGLNNMSSTRYLHAPEAGREFCPVGVVASRGDYFERCVHARGGDCAVAWQSGVSVTMQEQAVCLQHEPGWHATMQEHDENRSLRIGEMPLEIAFIEDTVQKFEDAIMNGTALAVDGESQLKQFLAEYCETSGAVCETLRVTPDNTDTGFALGEFETSTAVSTAIERAHPGLKMATSNLAWMQFVNEYEVATFYTGWAPATKRTWSAAVQNSERGSGFACDCNTDVPRFFCNRVPLDSLAAAGLNSPQLEAEMQRMHESGTGPRQDSVDLLQCSFGWQQTRAVDPIGLYLWSEKRELEVLQTDIFHGIVPTTNGTTLPHISLAESLMADGGFTEHIADKVTFSGYSANQSHPHVVSHLTYPTTCVRWPYGQVHMNAFTKKGRDKWYPPDFDAHDALMGYCEKYAGKFVHCRRDGMSLEDRTAFCDRNPMASYVFMGFVLRETRSTADVCSASGHLCVVVAGYGDASSVASALKMVAVGGTVLVAPFAKQHVTFAMHTQWYRRIGSNPTMSRGVRVPSQLLSEWDDNASSPIGVRAAHNAVSILAHIDDDTSVDQALDAMTDFWDDLMNPNGGAKRAFSEQRVCAVDEISIPGANNGVESIQCIKRVAVHQPIGEAELVVNTAGVTLASAVRSVGLSFGGKGNAKSCTRVKVEAANFTLGEVVFDQADCVCPDLHTHTPVVIYGARAINFAADNMSVTGTDVAVAALGGYGSEDDGATVLNISGFRATVSGSATWCAAFARSVGKVRVACTDSKHVLVQSARPGVSVDVRSLANEALDDTYTLANVSEYTGLFSFEEERRIYHRPTDVSSTAWFFAVISVMVATAMWFINGLLWIRSELVLATIAEEMLDRARFVGSGHANSVFEIYTEGDEAEESRTFINFLQGTEAGNKVPQRAFVVASKILFTASDCYEEYAGLIDHVYSSLR